MQHQRKRFSYLTVQQRALNSSNAIDTDKTAHSKPEVILSSQAKSYQKQQLSVTQMYTSVSRNSSAKKPTEPLAELQQNCIFSNVRTSATKNPTISNKQNVPQRQSLKSNEKPSSALTSRPINEPNLQSRVKQLEEQNSMILKQTEDKFLQMERHLEKVENILKEKENTIENLANENTMLIEKCRNLEGENGRLKDQKEQLLKIIGEKNEQIKRILLEKQAIASKQDQIMEQLNTYTLKSKLETIESIKPKAQPTVAKTSSQVSNASSSIQTELKIIDIEQLMTQLKQSEGNDKLNYRQKYEALFKKALEMEDEMYRLKQQLFDSQNQVKTVQQEFNTYKIFHQIDKINLQN